MYEPQTYCESIIEYECSRLCYFTECLLLMQGELNVEYHRSRALNRYQPIHITPAYKYFRATGVMSLDDFAIGENPYGGRDMLVVDDDIYRRCFYVRPH